MPKFSCKAKDKKQRENRLEPFDAQNQTFNQNRTIWIFKWSFVSKYSTHNISRLLYMDADRAARISVIGRFKLHLCHRLSGKNGGCLMGFCVEWAERAQQAHSIIWWPWLSGVTQVIANPANREERRGESSPNLAIQKPLHWGTLYWGFTVQIYSGSTDCFNKKKTHLISFTITFDNYNLVLNG